MGATYEEESHHMRTTNDDAVPMVSRLAMRRNVQVTPSQHKILGASPTKKQAEADLEALESIEVEHQGKRFLLRTEARDTSGAVFRAVGVALPPTVQQIKE